MAAYGVIRSSSAIAQWTIEEMMSLSNFSRSKRLVTRKTRNSRSRSYSKPPSVSCLFARARSSRTLGKCSSSRWSGDSETTTSAFNCGYACAMRSIRVWWASKPARRTSRPSTSSQCQLFWPKVSSTVRICREWERMGVFSRWGWREIAARARPWQASSAGPRESA